MEDGASGRPTGADGGALNCSLYAPSKELRRPEKRSPESAAVQRSIVNPHAALVFLIGHPNDCKRNPYLGTVQRMKQFSILTEVSILKLHAIKRIILG